MRILISLLLLVSMFEAKAQINGDDYKVLSSILESNRTQVDTLRLVSEPLIFADQLEFFRPTFFERYTYRVIGVNGNRVKKLIRQLDFNYLANQVRIKHNWEIQKLSVKVIKYQKNASVLLDGKSGLSISQPIYSKDGKFSFTYVRSFCGYMDCGGTNIYVHKRKGSKWANYVIFPISLH